MYIVTDRLRVTRLDTDEGIVQLDSSFRLGVTIAALSLSSDTFAQTRSLYKQSPTKGYKFMAALMADETNGILEVFISHQYRMRLYYNTAVLTWQEVKKFLQEVAQNAFDLEIGVDDSRFIPRYDPERVEADSQLSPEDPVIDMGQLSARCWPEF